MAQPGVVAPDSSTRRLPWSWFWIGIGLAVFLIATQAIALDGLAGLLLVGEEAALRPYIEQILGDIPLVAGSGHDGQIYFAMAHDLDGDIVADLLNNPGIRYRRPILPLLASFGGLLDGTPVLWSTAAWITAGTGVATMSLRALLERLGRSPLWMIPLLVYPGFWLAIRLLTPDMVALGAVMFGLVLHLRGSHRLPVVLLMTVAALTKEAFLVVPLALGAWTFLAGRRRHGLGLALIPTGVLAVLVAIVLRRFDVQAVDGNFGLPLSGFLEARSTWAFTPVSDRLYVYLTIGLLAVSVVALFAARSSLVRWLIAPWPLLGVISSEWIWEVGNGVARSFAPVILFVTLAFAERASGGQLTADP